MRGVIRKIIEMCETQAFCTNILIQLILEVDRHLYFYNILWIILLRCKGQVTTSSSFGFLYNGDNACYPITTIMWESSDMCEMYLVYWIINCNMFSTTRHGILTLFSIDIWFGVSTLFSSRENVLNTYFSLPFILKTRLFYKTMKRFLYFA